MVASTSPAYGRSEAEAAVIAFVRVRDRELRQVRADLKTRVEVLATLRNKFNGLCANYLRQPGTTYSAWLDFGPVREWHEVLTAADDPSVWDRLCERFDTREVDRG